MRKYIVQRFLILLAALLTLLVLIFWPMDKSRDTVPRQPDVPVGQSDGGIDVTSSLPLVLLSGAAGALMPVLLQPYFRHRRTLYKRRVLHANNLVRLELKLLDIDSGLNDNIFAVEHIVEAVRNQRATTQRPVPLVLEEKYITDSYSQELNQMLHSLRYDLRRLEQDVLNFNQFYNTLNQALMSKSIDADYYEKQVVGLTRELPVLVKHLKRIHNDSMQLLAYVRVRQEKDRTWLMDYRKKILQKDLTPVSPEEVAVKRKQHEQDVENNRRKFEAENNRP